MPRSKRVGEMDYLVHSPRWGIGFQKTAQERGAKCYLEVPRSSFGEVLRICGTSWGSWGR